MSVRGAEFVRIPAAFYKIIDLTGGSASGMFSDFEDNFAGHATCEIDGNNDVIMTIERPTGTAVMVG